MECHDSQKLVMRKLAHSNSGSHQHRTFLPSSVMASNRIVAWTLVFSTLVFSIHGCNIDTTRPVFYKPPSIDAGGEDYSDGLFGYTILEHINSKEEYVLVGAPTANSYYLDFNKDPIERPGALFRCRARSPQSCFEINLDESGNTKPVLPEFQHKKQNAWIGASLTRQPTKPGDELSDITVCGPRYANDYYVQYASDSLNTTFDPNETFLNGICYSFGHDGSGDVPVDRVDLVTASIPCGQYNQTNGVDTYIHGLCQAGMSAQYTSDGSSIMLGALGSYNWTGTIFEGDKDDLDFRPLADVWGEDYDYFGYAVTSGNFISKDTVQGVTSAPRAIRKLKEMTTGKVIIYNLDTQEVYQELYGDMMNTYYGSVVVAVDVNNDGWTDLLVGAPLYSVEQDEGRVYVYINNGRGEVEPTDILLSGSNAFGARFGSAIANAGDLNNDGYNDIVIGAPWEDENTGAVYVYSGSQNGVRTTPSQRLAGRDFVLSSVYDKSVPNITGFGMSLDGGSDMDLNGLSDIVVGAPASDLVILFKTRPVANMEVWLEMVPDPMDPDLQNCDLDGKPITCVNVSVCFRYEAASTPPTMDMDIELTVDYDKVKDGLDARFYFLENNAPTNSFYDLVVARYSQTQCYTYTAYLEKNALDFLSPLAFHLYYGIHEYEYIPPRGDNPEKFVGGLPPIIDESICGNGTLIDTLKFIQDCGADAICQTDLQLTSEVIFPSDDPYFILGAYSSMWIQATIHNTVEEAHNAKLIVKHSKEVVFEALEQSKSSCVNVNSVSAEEAICSSDIVVTCQPKEYVNITAVECSLGTRDPMKPGTTQFLRLRFDVGGMQYGSQGTLDLTVEATTISTELKPSNNINKTSIPIKIEADTTMFGRSEPASVYYETNKTSSDNADVALMEALIAVGVISVQEVEEMRTDYEIAEVMINGTEDFTRFKEEDIGPPFSLSFRAINEGPGRLPFNSVVYISIPWRHSNGDWFIYIKDIKSGGSGSVKGNCNSDEVKELQMRRLEEHYVNRTATPWPESDLERVYDGAYGVETSKGGGQLTCSNSKCVTVKCAINGPILHGENFVVTVEALLWVPTFLQNELYLRVKEVITQSVIDVAAPDGVTTQPIENLPDFVNLATGIFTDKPPNQPVAWWIILISILGGILLLLLIILILWKCGFFKRKEKDELEKLQQAAKI